MDIQNKETTPQLTEISDYISNMLWDHFLTVLTEEFSIKPKLEYSGCSMEAGWNIKFKKKGRNMCTIYPKEGFFKALIVTSQIDEPSASLFIGRACEYLQNIYEKTPHHNNQRWLTLDITNEEILQDALKLIEIKINSK